MAATDSPWQALIAAALIGTERQPWQPAIAPGKLGQVLTQLQHKPTETTLLLVAATLSLHQQVGWQPETRPLLSVPCPVDDLPPCSPRAARCLQQILADQYPQLLTEWLHLAAIAQQRAPAMHLPALLDKGRQQRELRPAILPVLGQRGRWLAAQNPDWSYAAAFTTEADWETGTSAARLLALQELRSQQPDRARELLQSAWSQEVASDRAKFLETLQTGLSLADEPFLEQALGDRSKEVRRVAIDLLASLPHSRFCQQIAEQTCRYLSLANNPNVSLQVQLPDQFEATWGQLGLEAKPTSTMNSKLGEKAWWLLQMISATPLNLWTERWQLSPQAIIQLTQSHEWQSVLLDGFALAAKRQRHSDWLGAIIKFWVTGQSSIGRTVALVELGTEDLVTALPADRRDALLIDLFQLLHRKINDSLTIWLLRYSSPPWSLDLAQLVLESLEQHLNQAGTFLNSDWELRAALKEFGRFIPVALTSEVINLRARMTADYAWIQSIDEILTVLQFRQDMTQSFQKT